MVFKAAICPSCGGNLQVPDDRDSVKCMYCGTDIIVRQAIQAGSGVNIQNYLELAVTAQKSENFQEAYNYYSKVLEIDIKNSEAWFGKARAAGWLSTVGNSRFPEVISGFQNAIAYVSDNDKNDLQIQCAIIISEISYASYTPARQYILDYAKVDGAWENYLSRSGENIKLLEYGHTLNPNESSIILGIIYICKDNLEGVTYKYPTGVQHNPSPKSGLASRAITGSVSHALSEATGIRAVTPVYEKVLKAKMDHFIAIIQRLDPSYKPPTVQKKSSCGCFIITATMGCSYHPYVLTLQDFRESWLKKRSYGRTFTRNYERYGPHFADIIRNRKLLKLLSLHLIVKPSVKLASFLLK